MDECSVIKCKGICKLTESNIYDHLLKSNITPHMINLSSISSSISTKAINWLNTELGIIINTNNKYKRSIYSRPTTTSCNSYITSTLISSCSQ